MGALAVWYMWCFRGESKILNGKFHQCPLQQTHRPLAMLPGVPDDSDSDEETRQAVSVSRSMFQCNVC